MEICGNIQFTLDNHWQDMWPILANYRSACPYQTTMSITALQLLPIIKPQCVNFLSKTSSKKLAIGSAWNFIHISHMICRFRFVQIIKKDQVLKKMEKILTDKLGTGWGEGIRVWDDCPNCKMISFFHTWCVKLVFVELW